MFSFITLIVIAFGIIAVIVMAVGIVRTDRNQEGGQRMIKSAFQYLVLFATLMMTIGGSVSAFMAIADIVSPRPYYQSFESYVQIHQGAKGEPGTSADGQVLTEEILRSRYDAMVREEKQNEVARAVNNLIKSLGWIVIPLPVFLYYQRRIGKN